MKNHIVILRKSALHIVQKHNILLISIAATTIFGMSIVSHRLIFPTKRMNLSETDSMQLTPYY